METRRQFLSIAATTVALAPLVAWLSGPSRGAAAGDEAGDENGARFRVRKSAEEWRANLTPEQYRVLREHRTERAFTSSLNREHRPGTFACAGCGAPLFASGAKYDSGTGWPSFTAPLDGAVGTTVDRSFFMVRTEVHCAQCGGHLGHVFPGGPPPTGQRYCINGDALNFIPED